MIRSRAFRGEGGGLWRGRALGWALWLGVVGACGGTSEPVVFTSCEDHGDCPGQTYCIDGLCVDARAAGCTADEDCGEGLRCLSDGRCQPRVACQEDADCCEGRDPECVQVCVGGVCQGDECVDDATQVCFDECHAGTQTCVDGVWQACDAAPVGVELCDGADNDCDGETDEGCDPCDPPPVTPDEEICGDGQDNDCDGATDEDCEACVPGEEVCDDGVDNDCDGATDEECDPCDPPPATPDEELCGDGVDNDCDGATDEDCEDCAPGEEISVPCAMCGHLLNTCADDGTWVAGETCLDQGVCEPGTQKEEACGDCGVAVSVCGDDCAWGAPGSCDTSGSVCTPGDVDEALCGDCGLKSRPCLETCTWGDFGSCEGQGVCTEGQVTSESCGNCGHQDATCNASCAWGAFGVCTDEGACAPGDEAVQPCGTGKEQSRVCEDDCAWGAWGACEVVEVCGAGMAPCPDNPASCCDYSDGGCEWASDPYCPGCVCASCVCAKDAFCCQTGWDSTCVDLCEGPCGGCGVFNDGCEPQASSLPACDGEVFDLTNHCYKAVSSGATWSDAQSACESWGGYLATVHSEAENAFVQGLGSCGVRWVGLSDEADEGTFLWVDGTDLSSPTVFTSWADDEPNNGFLLFTENCVEMMADGLWNDQSCSNSQCYVCERFHAHAAGCDGCSCEACVCDGDSFCCSTQWDGICVDACDQDCGGCGFRGCESEDGPGCGGCPCQGCVCADDAYCCDVLWDAFCASTCADTCGGCAALPVE